ncbi:MAG: MazG nucleotide pyrophosphohydrolase domain-containing protein [Nocardioides sp.]
MARLRAECAWKAGQTHRSLARYLLEETHETLEAIDAGDATGDWEHLREELGDLLLQVWFHAVIAAESGTFTIDDVASDLIAKLVRRNPHVFGDASAAVGGAGREVTDGGQVTDAGEVAERPDAATINEVWEAIKASEKQRTSVFDGLPPTLPALLLADKVLDRLSRSDPSAEVSVLARRGVTSGHAEPSVVASRTVRSGDPAEDIGERLLALVAEAREAGVDPEQALRDVVRRLA